MPLSDHDIARGGVAGGEGRGERGEGRGERGEGGEGVGLLLNILRRCSPPLNLTKTIELHSQDL